MSTEVCNLREGMECERERGRGEGRGAIYSFLYRITIDHPYHFRAGVICSGGGESCSDIPTGCHGVRVRGRRLLKPVAV